MIVSPSIPAKLADAEQPVAAITQACGMDDHVQGALIAGASLELAG
jgi:hypothetical protein